MIDFVLQEIWFEIYRDEAFKLVGRSRKARAAAVRWARSMAKIAEQHDDEPGEEVDALEDA